MQTPNTPTNEHPVVTALHKAYDLALQNLTDCTDDPQLLAACAADVAALGHLLANDGPLYRVNILAYLA